MRPIGLRFLDGPRIGLEISFSGSRVRVGRSRDNDLVLPDEEAPASSARHAELERHGRQWLVRDLGSMNGTWVNGARVETARLRSGDRIGFGGPPLVECRLAGHRTFAWAGAAAALAAAALAVSLQTRAPAGFEAAAERAVRAVYLVAVENGGQRTAIGTAFAVRSDGVLASNAHVAEELLRRVAADAGARAVALRSDSGEARALAAVRYHREYRPGGLGGDVALLALGPGPPLEPLPLADRAAVVKLRRGVRVGAFGFPAPATDTERPRGRLSEDVLGDVRDGRFLEVGLRIAPGMSGSPIFTSDGLVIGLVVGGDFVPAGAGARPVSSGVNWGLSVLPLRELLAAPGENIPLAGDRR